MWHKKISHAITSQIRYDATMIKNSADGLTSYLFFVIYRLLTNDGCINSMESKHGKYLFEPKYKLQMNNYCTNQIKYKKQRWLTIFQNIFRYFYTYHKVFIVLE